MNILRQKDVSNKVKLSKATMYNLINQGLFPAPIRLGLKSVGWTEESIDNWITSRPSAK